jgi:ADP-dependent NAD(P)H-hydrate dehydratase
MKTLIDPALLRSMPLPQLAQHGDKEARGAVLVFAGGPGMAGVAALVGEAALRAGAGKLQLAAVPAHVVALSLSTPEALVITAPQSAGEISASAAQALADDLRKADAVIVGPGMTDAANAGSLALELLKAAPDKSFIVDAAALTGIFDRLDDLHTKGLSWVVTPHAGEMASCLKIDKQAVLDDPVAAGLRAARQLNAVVIVKGATSHIVAPDGRVFVHEGGVVGLGASGSGDVLAGIIGGLQARGADPLTATCWGVWLHGAAGRRLCERVGRLGFLARELAAQVPALSDEVTAEP